jgi:polysaccharide chain length determinant protein (PEP-CTERM system associated)
MATSHTPTQQQASNEAALAALGKVWRRRRWIAMGILALTFPAAASFVFSLPDIYSATATVLVNPDGAQDAAAGSGGVTDENRLDSVSEAVLSRGRLLDLVTRFELYPELRRTSSMDTVLARMRQDIRLERKSGEQQWGQDPTFAFMLTYQGWDPQTVARVTNALASSYVDENNRMRTRQATDTVESLSAQLNEIKQKLDAQEQKINAFKDSHLGELPEQQAANLSTLQQLNVQSQENSVNLSQALQRRETLLKQMTDSGDADLAQLEQELASLRTRYTDMYPDVVRVKQQIANLKRTQVDQGGAAKPASPLQQQYQSLETEIKSYKQEEGRLRSEISAYQGRVDNVPLRAQQLQALTQGYGEIQDVYSSLLKRYEQARLAQAPQGAVTGQYRVLEPAIPPTDASGPARMRLLLMSLVLCLGLAGAAVLLAEQLDASFHSVDDLRAFTRVPVLVSIPRIVTTDDVWRRRLRFGTAIISMVVVLLVAAELSSLLGRGNEHLVWMLSRHAS